MVVGFCGILVNFLEDGVDESEELKDGCGVLRHFGILSEDSRQYGICHIRG